MDLDSASLDDAPGREPVATVANPADGAAPEIAQTARNIDIAALSPPPAAPMNWTGLAPPEPAETDEAEEETTAELPAVSEADVAQAAAAVLAPVVPPAEAAPAAAADASPAEAGAGAGAGDSSGQPAEQPKVVWSSSPSSGSNWPPRGPQY
jgi:hypothetical protein